MRTLVRDTFQLPVDIQRDDEMETRNSFINHIALCQSDTWRAEVSTPSVGLLVNGESDVRDPLVLHRLDF